MKTGILHFDELPEKLKKAGFPADIPIQAGNHNMDYDVREELLSADVVQAFKDNLSERRLAKRQTPVDDSKPIGIDQYDVTLAGGKIIWDDEPGV